ncbi:terpene synthase family protein [Streptomyces hainanensis]|uniref:Terpene synthase n=1 Tax=Streptomyces hainanensis TaxID=402648 RepID=A0A4R4SNR0_9ACTN|nr:terpene cyclase [Streptomyces hainanensis]TDC63839.1 terpene cyclase [Streptomyces hainanensis]
MPQDISFYLPFRGSINPGASRARAHHLDWVRRHGLVAGEEAVRRYQGWQLTDLAAYAYPEAGGGDLDLVTDAVCLGFPLDDLFDGPFGRQPERVAQLVTELAAVPYRVPGTRPRLDAPVVRAYTDVWRRSVVGMSQDWRARAAANLARFFRAYVREARNRAQGAPMDEAGYVRLRRQAVGTAPCFDLIERAGHFEVPPGLYWSREVRLLTRCAGDVVFLCNDVHSVEREEAQGDPHNLVLIRERTRGSSREEAVRQVTRLVASRARLFVALSARVPELCERWGVDDRGRADLERYLTGLRGWMVGNQRWGVVTARYARPAPPVAPPVAATIAGEGVAAAPAGG